MSYPPHGKPHFFADNVRPFRLTPKERARACEDVVIISRPQHGRPELAKDGTPLTFLACVIRVSTGYPVGVGILCPRVELSMACQELGRDCDKFWGVGGEMADNARDRPSRKPQRRLPLRCYT